MPLSAQQQFGRIQGKVTDLDGDPCAGATIRATNLTNAGGTTLETSDSTGFYRFAALLPGAYVLKMEVEGLPSIFRSGISLSPGSTASVDFSCGPTGVANIEVTGSTPLIDSSTTAISHIVPVEIVEALPKPDSIMSMLSWTPGVGDDLVAYGGTKNRLLIDSVVVNSPLGGSLYAQYNPNWIQDLQVTGVGAPSEYEGYDGVVGNFATRSGGNHFHGLFETLFQNENFTSENVPDGDPEQPFHSYDISAQLGGPILKDILWFFSGVQLASSQTEVLGYDGVTTEEYPKAIAKVTYKPSSSNTLQGFAHYNWYKLDGDGASASTLPEATSVTSCDETSWNGTWISLLGSQSNLEARFGGFWANCRSDPRNGNIPGHYDRLSGISSANAPFHFVAKRFRPQVNFSFSRYGDQFLGSHDFKFGVQLEDSSAENVSGLSGGILYYDYGGPALRIVSSGDSREDDQIFRAGMFAQDSWSLSDRLTLSLGFRFDYNRGSTNRGVVFETTPVSPRIGAIYNPFAGQQTVVKASFGDYAEPLMGVMFSELRDSSDTTTHESYDPERGAWILDFVDPPRHYVADSNLKHPYIREFTFGIDHELFSNIVVGAHYIQRRWKNILEDINLNQEFEPVTVINPLTGEPLVVYRRTFAGASERLLINPEGLYRRYDGLEFSGSFRLFRNLHFTASFNYSRIRGNLPNAGENPFSQWMNTPNFTVNFQGRLPNDPSIAWKIASRYDFPLGICAGMFLRHETGDTWTPLIEINLNPGRATVFGEPMGSRRLPATTLMDLRIEKVFFIRSTELSLLADIFNVFNSAYVKSVDDLYSSETFEQPFDYTAPRTMRLGFRYTF